MYTVIVHLMSQWWSLKLTCNFICQSFKQETAKDVKAGLQSKFQNFDAKVNQNVAAIQTDIIS